MVRAFLESIFPLSVSFQKTRLQSGLVRNCIELKMKKNILFVLFITFVSCKNETKEKTEPAADTSAVKVSGQELFEGEGNCIACQKKECY